jgi:gamma-glutamyltranspeptidase/glutathione hydrolase
MGRMTGTVAAAGPAVATAAVPRAAEAALAVLADGGNAYDAAVAACLAECVWLPMKCGLAGDLVALVREPTGSLETLISIGPGGAAFSPGAGLAVTGPRSVGVPGAPDGYAALAARGRLPLIRLAAPAIAMARAGVTWLPVAVALTKEAETTLRAWNGSNAYLPDGHLPRVGEALFLPGQAQVLEAFTRLGAELFWHDLGARLAERLARSGGLLRAEDLRVRPARWIAPERAALEDGVFLSVTPAPTHGPRLADALQLVLSDAHPPVVAMRNAMKKLRSNDGGTSVVAVGDAEGRAVIVVHSNSFPQYGAGVLLEELDLVLNNRPGRGFDLKAGPEDPNAPAPGRVPTTTLHAWALERSNGFCMGATPGGVNQAPWNLQTILDLLRGVAPSNAVTAPRWSFNPTGELIVEADHPDVAALNGQTIPPLGQRSAEQVLSREADIWHACADPRTGAVALAAPELRS